MSRKTSPEASDSSLSEKESRGFAKSRASVLFSKRIKFFQRFYENLIKDLKIRGKKELHQNEYPSYNRNYAQLRKEGRK